MGQEARRAAGPAVTLALLAVAATSYVLQQTLVVPALPTIQRRHQHPGGLCSPAAGAAGLDWRGGLLSRPGPGAVEGRWGWASAPTRAPGGL